MANRTAARRYVRALFDVCEREGDVERVEREVSAFAALLSAHPALRKSLLSPLAPPAPRRNAVAAILDRAGDLSPITRRLLTLLAERDRLALLPEIVAACRDRLLERQGVVRAHVTTSAPLPDGRMQEITRQLEAATGRRVLVEAAVDPAVIGGVVTRIGSMVWDGSIARHLARLRERLLGGAAG